MGKPLLDFLKANNYFYLEELSNLKYCCCPSDKKVIDFDRIKDEFYKLLGLGHLSGKSVDALVFGPNYELYFGEFTSFKMRQSITGCTLQDFLTKEFQALELPRKVYESYTVLLGLFGHHGLGPQDWTYFYDSSKFCIKVHLILDIDNVELMDVQLMSLNTDVLRPSRMVDSNVIITNCDAYHTFLNTTLN